MRAFSLIELLVSVSILTVITGVVLANNTQFNSSVLLGNAAYDIALTIREAQVYGLSTQAFGGEFQVGYGVHFSSAREYVLFADVDQNRNRRYDAGVDQVVRQYTLGRGFTIAQLCATRTDQSVACSQSSASLEHLDIAFLRPNPDATITGTDPKPFSSARITITSPSGETRTISVQSTGQISVQKP